MPIKVLDAPLSISLDDLQVGIQSEEDSGYELVDLSKGTSAGAAVNLASFQAQTGKLADIRLIPTPSGLFVESSGSYSVDSAASDYFVEEMRAGGLSVVLYCPIVAIKGSNTSLAVARQVTAPPWIGGPLPSVTLSWDNASERRAWSCQLIASIAGKMSQLEQGNPDSFIAGYSRLATSHRIKFWAELLIAIAKYESDWNKDDIYHEHELGYDSVGLLQLSYQDQSPYKLESLNPAAKSLQDPLVNLRCGVTIFAKLVAEDKTVASSDGGRYRGAARYWSTIRAGPKHYLSQITALTKKNVGL